MVKLESVEFTSAGNILLGRMYRPEGRMRKAAVTFCHGFPGARAGEPKKWIQVEGADHSFSEHRTPLIRGVLDWLMITL